MPISNQSTDNWVSVPTNSVVTIHKQTVLLHPIIDEFYSEDLSQDRSSCYAVSKGLVSTAPGTTVQPQTADEPCSAGAGAGAAAEPRNAESIDYVGDVRRGLSHLQIGGEGGLNQCAVSH